MNSEEIKTEFETKLKKFSHILTKIDYLMSSFEWWYNLSADDKKMFNGCVDIAVTYDMHWESFILQISKLYNKKDKLSFSNLLRYVEKNYDELRKNPDIDKWYKMSRDDVIQMKTKHHRKYSDGLVNKIIRFRHNHVAHEGNPLNDKISFEEIKPLFEETVEDLNTISNNFNGGVSFGFIGNNGNVFQRALTQIKLRDLIFDVWGKQTTIETEKLVEIVRKTHYKNN